MRRPPHHLHPKTWMFEHNFEFHISRQARDYYQFNERLYSIHGNVIFADFLAVRAFTQKMNAQRDLVNYPERAVKAGQINAMGIIDEIFHHVVGLYRQAINPGIMVEALTWLYERLGQEAVDTTLRQFVDQFPPVHVYNQELSTDDYLKAETNGFSHRAIVLEEMMMVWLANVNPAFNPFRELFADSNLEKHTAYQEIIKTLGEFFKTKPNFGPDDQNLIEMLRSPAVVSPHSLPGQLEYIRERWGSLIGRYLYRLLSSLDWIEEERIAVFAGPGPAQVMDFSELELEAERFSPDQDWMPNLVLIAKNTYVWLDQLSKRYQHSITTLDQVPNEALDQLASWGFSGLWLIGLWERSPASKRIKQMCGNPEAVSSAYSLYDYVIANDLGGEGAYKNLRERAWERGIRLAADMVPNHVGIVSKWVIEHPNWFISLDHKPFPTYSFNGPDLIEDERVSIYLEDHYYDRSDAAVVFKRVDRWTGRENFIYHGNDGTSMPWNDTAQLNFLNPEVREAVIQTILHVARKFSVIRFDAAMTLSKKHYQRLWFPEPGTGGAIPTRSEYGLTKEEFDQAMPTEFWREVVDRVAQEVPNTLLLAEAFWLMEGYFVRTLGMHRVYNSAFMNMLRDEKNQEYRLVIKNTLEFDPQILKRFVNFMNNPDEETAVDQFGKDDKYFGVCTLMVTMPGLPMFGHGQIEGFREKYGMEYRRAYWDESPDQHLIERHKREIFPLLYRRHIFAGVESFLFYDFKSPEGNVNEDVFAYSNRDGEEKCLVIYHNKWAEANGWIKSSCAYLDKGSGQLVQKTLGQGLELDSDPSQFTIFRDQVSGLEYIRNNTLLVEEGLYIELGAYKYHVFLDFRQVDDNEYRQYAQLEAYLDGRGVPNIQEAMKELFLQPIHYPFRELVNAATFRRILEITGKERTDKKSSQLNKLLGDVEFKIAQLFKEIKEFTQGRGDEATLADEVRRKLEVSINLPSILDRASLHSTFSPPKHLVPSLVQAFEDEKSFGWIKVQNWWILLSWLFTHNMGKILDDSHFNERSRSWLDEWLLGRILNQTFQDLGMDTAAAKQAVTTVKILIAQQDWTHGLGENQNQAEFILRTWLNDHDIQRFLGVNRYRGVLWFNQESYQELLRWMLSMAIIQVLSSEDLSDDQIPTILSPQIQVIDKLFQAEGDSDYQVERLLEALQS